MVVLDYPFRILTAFALIAASLEAAKSKERLRNLRDSSRRKIQEANDLSEECLAIISNPTFIGDGYCDLVGNYNTQGEREIQSEYSLHLIIRLILFRPQRMQL